MAKEKRTRTKRATAGMEPRDRFAFQTGTLASLVNKYVVKAQAFGKAASGDDAIGKHFANSLAELGKAQAAISALPADFNPAGGYQRRVIQAGDGVTIKDDYATTYEGIAKPGDKLTVEKVAGTDRAVVLIVKDSKGRTIPLAKTHVKSL